MLLNIMDYSHYFMINTLKVYLKNKKIIKVINAKEKKK